MTALSGVDIPQRCMSIYDPSHTPDSRGFCHRMLSPLSAINVGRSAGDTVELNGREKTHTTKQGQRKVKKSIHVCESYANDHDRGQKVR